jgi:hypothetical protein
MPKENAFPSNTLVSLKSSWLSSRRPEDSEAADNLDNPIPNSFNDRAAGDEVSSLLVAARNGRGGGGRKSKVVLAGLYAVQVFYSFFIM